MSLAPTAAEYGRFNLLLWDGAALRFASNHPRFVTHAVAPGLHAMSNGAFDAPWPKSGHATRALQAWLAGRPGARRGTGRDRAAVRGPGRHHPRPDAALPDTGVGLALERALSPPFVRGPRYGTRCSTVVLVAADAITFVERRFGPDARPLGQGATSVPRTRA